MWAAEKRAVCSTRKDRHRLAWFKTGIWKLRRMRTESEKESFPLGNKQENAVHIATIEMFGNEEVTIWNINRVI